MSIFNSCFMKFDRRMVFTLVERWKVIMVDEIKYLSNPNPVIIQIFHRIKAQWTQDFI